jgi:hypothetical protein
MLYLPQFFPRQLVERLFQVSDAPLPEGHSLIRGDGLTFVEGHALLAAVIFFLGKI